MKTLHRAFPKVELRYIQAAWAICNIFHTTADQMVFRVDEPDLRYRRLSAPGWSRMRDEDVKYYNYYASRWGPAPTELIDSFETT